MESKFISYKSKYFPRGVIGIVSGQEVHPCVVGENYVDDMYDLVEDWDAIAPSLRRGKPSELVASVHIQAPFVGRDVIGIAKNFRDHPKDGEPAPQPPTFPMFFTKRATSIIPTGAEIYHHLNVTKEIDYEGEVGIIIGKGGFGIPKEEAWKHIWGATIVNDISARDRQRDHKQFYIGKSLDTFCPMGPFAVHRSALDWDNLLLETRVNGEVRQHSKTNDLIFDIPTLVETCSMGTTLQPGDVIATGTPAGIGSSFKPPVFLKPGDIVEVSVTNLGTLRNPISARDAPPPACNPVRVKKTPLLSPANAKEHAVPYRYTPTVLKRGFGFGKSSLTLPVVFGWGLLACVLHIVVKSTHNPR
ncbi:uncharacterized protein EI90DRAFT_2993863 [Cantharellus anzutake]|uniref:uncharacterized protein n=1 Tax=Cantharellus anzutake TaxID=1750568 RepID=UPI0019041830|nr:uncharacterized protein EI90DRAFT_2993863 [Cantharellus anzutake]KAF8334038.1 hypothetical protein EI90DRAFT_2993863 [Cantharellus anzutake]